MTELETYFKSLQSQPAGDVTEHSHRAALQALLESFAGTTVKVLHEPKREGKFGAPDFKITHTGSIVGYVENKKIGESLDKTIKSDQVKKYLSLSGNLLLTNYTEWVWLRDGEVAKREALCFASDLENKKTKLDGAKAEGVAALLRAFFSQAPEGIADAKKLAGALAARAKLLKGFLLDELQRQKFENTDGRLFQLYETFRGFVFNELTIEEFSDAFAQNLVYGLFLAKLNAGVQKVDLYSAKKFIPASFELIRELVNFLDELDNEEYRETRWIVEEIITIVNNIDLGAIQDSLSFVKSRKDEEGFPIKDPYIYFYEHFLAAYDQKLRKAKGVYYTPQPIVNFIVRSIDDILKDIFGIKEGLADKNKITVLDFATGTGTFLVEIMQQIFEKLPAGSAKKEMLIREHILKNIFGFEYLIAPYTIAHLKLSQFLKDKGYEMKGKERLQVYLTNTLEPISAQIKIPLLPALTDESKRAQQVKDKPILVITGNPPYSYASKNNGEWIAGKIKDYHLVDGKPLGEKNPKGLQDDYVKFIRFAQYKMEKVEEGVVAIITNHSFLDNPTFKGMRQSLMKTFDQIYLLDLHGNAVKKEKTPEGGKDENVFDIKQGVAVSVFIKKKGLKKKIAHADFWGTRADKYKNSLEGSFKEIEWAELAPTSPSYLFFPQNLEGKEAYKNGWAITDIFKIQSMGVTTANDELFIDVNKDSLFKKIKPAIKDTRPDAITEYAYRPFDKRFIYSDNKLIERPRENVMKHLAANGNYGSANIALTTLRRTRSQAVWSYAFVTDCITDKGIISPLDNGNIFPLYLIDNINTNGGNGHDIFEGPDIVKKTENFTKDFRNYIDARYGERFSPEQIFGYLYAILHSPAYRAKYAEFLKIDFPRIHFTEDKRLFEKLSGLGQDLISAHLLKEEDNSFVDFIGAGSNIVEKTKHVSENGSGKLYINKTQYFEDIPVEIYGFYIGGYQVLDKYLKDRKGRALAIDDLNAISNICKALAFTIHQMQRIDGLTREWV